MSDKQIDEAVKLFREKILAFKEDRGFRSLFKVAELVKIPWGTFSQYFRQGNTTLPSPETLAKICKKVPDITAEDARKIEIAYSRRSSQSHTRGVAKKSSLPAQTPAPVSSVITEINLSQDELELISLVRRIATKPAENRDTPVTTSPETLLSQILDQYEVGDMPFILSKDNFKKIDVSAWSEEEIKTFLRYANFVLEESRKCLMLLTQFQPDNVRNDMLERLGRNADLLWRTYQAASSVAPIEYVRDIQLANKCGQLNPNHNERKENL